MNFFKKIELIIKSIFPEYGVSTFLILILLLILIQIFLIIKPLSGDLFKLLVVKRNSIGFRFTLILLLSFILYFNDFI